MIIHLPGHLQPPEPSVDGGCESPARLDLCVKLEQRYKKNIAHKAMLLIKVLWNYRLIFNFVRNERPAAVVVGSDLGNVHIRFLIEACRHYHSPVFVLYNCDVPESPEPKAPKGAYGLVYNLFLERHRFLRAVFFQGQIPGRYHPGAVIFVMSEAVRYKLIQHGIEPERIMATGMPMTENHSIDKKTFLTQMSLPDHSRLIGFFSGPLGEVFGMGRERAVLDGLRQMRDELPADVVLIIKVHPRETPGNEAMLHHIFGSTPCRVVKSMSAEDMLPQLDLLLGYFSRLLITAASQGKRFFSINPWEDSRTLLNREEADILEINRLDDLTPKVRLALNDRDYQMRMDAACRAVASRYCLTDGRDPSMTIASLIYKSICR